MFNRDVRADSRPISFNLRETLNGAAVALDLKRRETETFFRQIGER